MTANRYTRPRPVAAALPQCEAWTLPVRGRPSLQCRNSAPVRRDGRSVCMGHSASPRIAFDPEQACRLIQEGP